MGRPALEPEERERRRKERSKKYAHAKMTPEQKAQRKEERRAKKLALGIKPAGYIRLSPEEKERRKLARRAKRAEAKAIAKEISGGNETTFSKVYGRANVDPEKAEELNRAEWFNRQAAKADKRITPVGQKRKRGEDYAPLTHEVDDLVKYLSGSDAEIETQIFQEIEVVEAEAKKFQCEIVAPGLVNMNDACCSKISVRVNGIGELAYLQELKRILKPEDRAIVVIDIGRK